MQEKQFTIILELVGDNKLDNLTAAERRSLALLKDGRKSSPYAPRYDISSEQLTTTGMYMYMYMYMYRHSP